jgi:hypothetical protein
VDVQSATQYAGFAAVHVALVAGTIRQALPLKLKSDEAAKFALQKRLRIMNGAPCCPQEYPRFPV